MMIQISRHCAMAFVGVLLVAAGVCAQPADDGVVALTGARLIDGTGREPIENGILVIRNGRIETVGAANAVTIPSSATRIDLSGKTILPGLINAHGHLNTDRTGRSSRDKLIGQLSLYADYGVTTVVVLGAGANDLDEAVRLRYEQDERSPDHARVYVAGPSLENLTTADEARARVDSYADANVDIVKIHITGGPNDMTPNVYGALIDQAHNRGLRVAAHLYYLKDAHGLLDAGVDVIAHSVRDQDVDAALIDKIKQQNVGYIPTLTRDLAQFVYETKPAFFTDPFFLRGIGAYGREVALFDNPVRREQIRSNVDRQAVKAGLAQASRNLKTLSDAGIVIAFGTDSGSNEGQWQGYFEHVELEMMVEAGMSSMRALVAATGGAARAMQIDREIGMLLPGRWADLLVLDANPIDDIRATREIDSVWIAGRRVPDAP
jgi:imidazolonepropionase-like amidohydrolase